VVIRALYGLLQKLVVLLLCAYCKSAQVCEVAAAAEASSEHPLARAVLEFAEARLSPSEQADKCVTSWTFDFRDDASRVHSNAHAPRTPPNEQQRTFTATFSLDEEHHSGSSTPTRTTKRHLQHPSSRSHSPVRHGSGGGSIQLVDIPLSQSHSADSSSSSNRHGQLDDISSASGRAKHWSAAAADSSHRSSGPNSPRPAVSIHHHDHHQGHGVGDEHRGRWSAAGSVPWSPLSTPGRLRHLLSNGLLRVSEVEVRRALLT